MNATVVSRSSKTFGRRYHSKRGQALLDVGRTTMALARQNIHGHGRDGNAECGVGVGGGRVLMAVVVGSRSGFHRCYRWW